MSEKLYDGADILANVSGLQKSQVLSVWEEVKANNARLQACPRHRFMDESVKIGQKIVCQNCGGQMGLTLVGEYIRGYEAHGGLAEDVWPNFAKSKLARTVP